MKNQVRRLLSLLVIMLMVTISLMKELPVQQVQASVTSEELAETYLNVLCKYLDLGKTGKNKFDFNINKEALQKGATYSWYIKADKGNPKAVTIDSKTGVVTAKNVGTAYIRCKITLANHMVLRPEAKVIVRNNITGIEISNISEDGKLNVGQLMDFNYRILNTVAGKDKTASGIIRWEIKNDTAGAGNATEEGVVVPQQAGKFSIRAVCFQSINDYSSWLVNKHTEADNITAASEWTTITVIATFGEAATQEQLNELLLVETITQITISTNAELKISIPKGDYSDKTLVVNAPNTDIINYGTFKLIQIKSATNSTWEENADNNSLMIYDSDISLLITAQSQVKSVEFGVDSTTVTADNRIQRLNINESQIHSFASDTDIVLVNSADVTVTGKIDELSISAVSKLILSGTGSVDKFTIKEYSKGTKVASSVRIDLVAYSDFIITLLKGAERSTISIPKNTTGTIENLTETSVDILPRTGFTLLTSGWAIYIPSSGTHTLLGQISTSSVIKFTPALVTAVIGSSINSGQTLDHSTLKGTFFVDSSEVAGILSWDKPDTVVNNSGSYKWTFTPLDTSHYNIVIGFARVVMLEEITPVLNAVKIAIDSANYTNLYVTDTSNTIQKLFAVQAVIVPLRGLSTVEVTWNTTKLAYDVTIKYCDISTTTTITSATFVN